MLSLYVSVPVTCFRKGLAREYLETEDVPRLRIGIETSGRDASGRDYVLDRFSKGEWETVLPALRDAVDAIDMFCERGIDETMTRFNRWE